MTPAHWKQLPHPFAPSPAERFPRPRVGALTEPPAAGGRGSPSRASPPLQRAVVQIPLVPVARTPFALFVQTPENAMQCSITVLPNECFTHPFDAFCTSEWCVAVMGPLGWSSHVGLPKITPPGTKIEKMTSRIRQDRTPIFPTPTTCCSLARNQLPSVIRTKNHITGHRSKRADALRSFQRHQNPSLAGDQLPRLLRESQIATCRILARSHSELHNAAKMLQFGSESASAHALRLVRAFYLAAVEVPRDPRERGLAGTGMAGHGPALPGGLRGIRGGGVRQHRPGSIWFPRDPRGRATFAGAGRVVSICGGRATVQHLVGNMGAPAFQKEVLDRCPAQRRRWTDAQPKGGAGPMPSPKAALDRCPAQRRRWTD
eukprot:gene13400-biopygen9564